MTGTTRAGTPRVATPPPGSPGRTPLPASPACWPGSAIRAAVVATLLATTLSIVPPLLRAESTEYPASRGTGPESAAPSGNSELPGDAAVDLQRQINDLRSDLLDERERRIVRLQEASGFAFGVLAALIGGGGPVGLCEVPHHRDGGEVRRYRGPGRRGRVPEPDPAGRGPA